MKGSAPKMVTEFTRILPLITHNLLGPSKFIIEYYGKDIDFENI